MVVEFWIQNCSHHVHTWDQLSWVELTITSLDSSSVSVAGCCNAISYDSVQKSGLKGFTYKFQFCLINNNIKSSDWNH